MLAPHSSFDDRVTLRADIAIGQAEELGLLPFGKKLLGVRGGALGRSCFPSSGRLISRVRWSNRWRSC